MALGVGGLLTLVAVIGWAIYTIHLVKRNSQTIGKKLVGIKVVRSDGSHASLGRIFWLRNVVNAHPIADSGRRLISTAWSIISSSSARTVNACTTRSPTRSSSKPEGIRASAVSSAGLDTVVYAETPEGIMIELRPAGLAARFYAFLLDWLIRLGVLLCARDRDRAHGRRRGRVLLIAAVRARVVLSRRVRAEPLGRNAGQARDRD